MITVNKLFLFIFVFALMACSSTKLTQTSMSNIDDNSFKYSVSDKFISAKRQLYQGNFDAAAKGFETCFSLDPLHDASYYELARMYENINPTMAIALCKRAINIDSKNIWYQEFLLRVYQQQKQYKNAIAVNKKLISLRPEHKEYYYQWANLCILEKDYKQALVAYNKLIEKFGYENGVLSQVKQIYLKQGKYNKAIETLETMLNHEPDNKSICGMIAEIYSKEGRNDKAKEYYQKILEIDPDDGFVHFALADYYRNIGNNNLAFVELNKGMSSPSLDVDSKMKVLMGMLDISKKDSSYKSKFIELLEIATKTNPSEPKILALKADYAFENQDYLNAVDYYHKIIAIDSSKFVIWKQLLKAQTMLKDYKSIKSESERALHIFPQHADLYYYNSIALSKFGDWKKVKERISMGSNFVYEISQKAIFLALRAKAEMHLGEIDNAKANYERAIRMDPNNTTIKKDYALDLASHNLDFTNAVAYAKDALELNANDPEYVYVYAYCLFKNGDKKQALSWLKPALKEFPNNKHLQLLDMEINKDE